MPFVQAKCPECGGMLAVDDSKKAANCQFCGEAFIVQEAVNNYNTYNTYSNTYDNRTTHNYGDGAVVNVYENQNSVSTLIERAFMFLEDRDFSRADEYCEKVLDIDPENAQAYLGKLMVNLKIPDESLFLSCKEDFKYNSNYKKILAFGDENMKSKMKNYLISSQENLNNHLKDIERVEILRKNAEEKTREKNIIFLKPKIERALKLQRRFDTRRYIMPDGTVCRLEENPDLYDVVTFSRNLFLKDNGTVVGASGRSWFTTEESKRWTNIVDVAQGERHSVGLKSDGTVIAFGENRCGQCDVENWSDIVAISAGYNHTVGLKSDGTVVATGEYLNEKHCSVSRWTDIVAISTGCYHTVGLKSDGTVVADGYTSCYEGFGSPSVSKWSDIIAIAAGDLFTVGLKSNGTVVTNGTTSLSVVKEAKKWKDIVAISAGSDGIVGLKSDGTLITWPYESAIGKICNDIDNIDEECRISKKERVHKQNRSNGCCQHCGGTFKGIFSKTCTKCGKPKDY